jgi:hypothetical protein
MPLSLKPTGNLDNLAYFRIRLLRIQNNPVLKYSGNMRSSTGGDKPIAVFFIFARNVKHRTNIPCPWINYREPLKTLAKK